MVGHTLYEVNVWCVITHFVQAWIEHTHLPHYTCMHTPFTTCPYPGQPPSMWHVHPSGHRTLNNSLEVLNFDQVGHVMGGGPRTIAWSYSAQFSLCFNLPTFHTHTHTWSLQVTCSPKREQKQFNMDCTISVHTHKHTHWFTLYRGTQIHYSYIYSRTL